MIFLKINCPNFSRLIWHRHTCHTASGPLHATTGEAITSLPSLQTFKRAVKTELFRRSYNSH